MYFINTIKKFYNKNTIQIDYNQTYESISKKYNIKKRKKKLIINITIGRSGSRWLTKIFTEHQNEFNGGTERDVLRESFYHYCNYYKLKIDDAPFFYQLKSQILEDWRNSDSSIICSPYFTFGLKKIIKELKPDYLILSLNEPFFTANSFYNKGMFKNTLISSKNCEITGLQQYYNNDISHYFGRVTPVGKNFKAWYKKSSRLKIAWYMNTTIKSIYSQIKNEKIYLFNLKKADQNYKFYLNLRNIFKIKKKLSKSDFMKIKKKSLLRGSNDNKFNNKNINSWKNKEIKSFSKIANFYFKLYKKPEKYFKKLTII